MPDGAIYFGKLGELAYDAAEDKVQCHLCGGWYRAIGGSHLRRTHGWSLAEYRDAFRLPMGLPTCSKDVSGRLRANAEALIQRGDFGQGIAVAVERRNEQIRPWRSLAAKHPDLAKELHPDRNTPMVDPSLIAAKSKRKLWWCCSKCGHAWEATVGSRSAGHGCPHCYNETRRGQGPREVPREQSLLVLFPVLTAEWDRELNGALDPATIGPGSKQRIWWRCAICGNSWVGVIRNRARGHGCPNCGIRRRAQARARVPYDRSIAARHPALARELHPTRNPALDARQLGARSGQKVWWRCQACGHEWKATVASRAGAGTSCPTCARHRRK